MIADMTSMDDELQLHKVYIHQYTNVRYGTLPSSLIVMIYCYDLGQIYYYDLLL